jgi:hypothetical protein
MLIYYWIMFVKKMVIVDLRSDEYYPEIKKLIPMDLKVYLQDQGVIID